MVLIGIRGRHTCYRSSPAYAHVYLLGVEYDEGEGLVHGTLEGGLDGHDSLLVSQSVERRVLHLQDLLAYPQWRGCCLGCTALRLMWGEKMT